MQNERLKIFLDVIVRNEKDIDKLKRQLSSLKNDFSATGTATESLKEKFDRVTSSGKQLESSVNKVGYASRRTATGFRRLAWEVVRAEILIRGLEKILQALYGAFRAVIDTIEDFKITAIEIASIQTSIAQSYLPLKDLPSVYNMAKEAAEDYYKTVLKLSAKTPLTAEQLQKMLLTFETRGQYVDLTKQTDAVIAIANAIYTLTRGQRLNIQITQEVRGILGDSTKQSSTLYKLLRMIEPEIDTLLEKWRQQGTIIANVGKLLYGYSLAGKDIQNTFSGLITTTKTFLSLLTRESFADFYTKITAGIKDALSVFYEFNKASNEWTGNLTESGKELINLFSNFSKFLIDFSVYLKDILLMIPKIFGADTTKDYISTLNTILKISHTWLLYVDALVRSYTNLGKTIYNAVTYPFKAAKDIITKGELPSNPFDIFTSAVENQKKIIEDTISKIDELWNDKSNNIKTANLDSLQSLRQLNAEILKSKVVFSDSSLTLEKYSDILTGVSGKLEKSVRDIQNKLIATENTIKHVLTLGQKEGVVPLEISTDVEGAKKFLNLSEEIVQSINRTLKDKSLSEEERKDLEELKRVYLSYFNILSYGIKVYEKLNSTKTQLGDKLFEEKGIKNLKQLYDEYSKSINETSKVAKQFGDVLKDIYLNSLSPQDKKIAELNFKYEELRTKLIQNAAALGISKNAVVDYLNLLTQQEEKEKKLINLKAKYTEELNKLEAKTDLTKLKKPTLLENIFDIDVGKDKLKFIELEKSYLEQKLNLEQKLINSQGTEKDAILERITVLTMWYEQEKSFLERSISGWQEFNDIIVSMWKNVGQQLKDSLADFFYDFKINTQDIVNIFRRATAEMLADFVSTLMKMMVKYLVFKAVTGGSWKTFSGGINAGDVGGVLSLPGFASGGYVTKPTVAVIGEAGPEYVIPEKKLESLTSGKTYNIIINAVDSQSFEDALKRNRHSIITIVNDEINNNSGLTGTIRSV